MDMAYSYVDSTAPATSAKINFTGTGNSIVCGCLQT